jgi:hypothetical protein
MVVISMIHAYISKRKPHIHANTMTHVLSPKWLPTKSLEGKLPYLGLELRLRASGSGPDG